MGNRAKNYNVSYLSGSVELIPADRNRNELFLRNSSTADIYLAFNETAVSGIGFYLKEDDGVILTGHRAIASIYATCDALSSGILNADITPG